MITIRSTRSHSFLLAAGIFAAAFLLAGCGRQQDGYKSGDNTVTIARPKSGSNEIGLQNERVAIPPGANPVESALTRLFQTADEPDKASAIPKGTRLLDLKVEGGIARINVSKEWNALKSHGSTTESLAENALRITLAQFPEIQKMLLIVEGRPFESEHADWSEPIPVRESNAAAGGAP